MLTDIPKIGYGTWNRPAQEAYDCTTMALEAGYRHLDCAEGYENEEFVGRALLLLHYPSIKDEFDITDYMAQFAEVYDAGLCRNIGVSNFTKPYLEKATALLGDRKLFTNQVELHVYLHNTPVVEDCRARGIPMTAFSPLARGAVLEDALLTCRKPCGG